MRVVLDVTDNELVDVLGLVEFTISRRTHLGGPETPATKSLASFAAQARLQIGLARIEAVVTDSGHGRGSSSDVVKAPPPLLIQRF